MASIGLLAIALLAAGKVTAMEARATAGEWSDLITWPHVPSSAALLPDGRVLTWSSNERLAFPDNGVRYSHSAIFNPADDTFIITDNPSHDMFCAGISLLQDGTVLAAGGNPQLQDTSYFDAATAAWRTGPFMNQQRWYGTTVTMPDDSVFATFARGDNNIPELLPRNGAWRELPGAVMDTLWNEQNTINGNAVNDSVIAQWNANMHVAPDGRVFHAGPTLTMHWFDVSGNGTMQEIGPRISGDQHRQGGTSTLFDTGRILLTGGSDKSLSNSATASALSIDINGATPVVTEVDALDSPRVYHNSVLMPNGEVMIIGGNTSGVLFDDTTSVLGTEIWNPLSGNFRTTAPIAVSRNYHSIALLLQDGRVLSGGGGLCGSCTVNHPDAQIYSPPYLFNANGERRARPGILAANATAQAGDTLLVDATANITRFNLLRLSSNTHSVNTDERLIKTRLQRVASGLYELELPDNPNVLLPGNYWLFGLDAAGTPSVGYRINVRTGVAPLRAPISMAPITVPIWQQDEPATLSVEATGGEGLRFEAENLPPGLTLNGVTGQISGIPSIAGNYQSTLIVRDARQAIAQSITFNIRTDSGIIAGSSAGSGWGLLLLVSVAWTARKRLALLRRHVL